MKFIQGKPAHSRSFVAVLCCMAALSACGGAAKKAMSLKKHPDPVARLTLLPERGLQAGKTVTVLAKLTHNKGLYALNDNDLKTVHTKKFHLLVVDPTLTDYQHIHPKPTDTPGLYSFQFTPKLNGGYRAWADITPLETDTQEFARSDMGDTGSLNITKTVSHEASIGGYHFTLHFDKTPEVGEASMGTIHITDSTGKDVHNLEEVMGAYSHIVGFYDDFRTIVHVHPMGQEPTSGNDRGGPDLTFHLEPSQAGFVKLFAQVKIGGKEWFVPFGIAVKGDK